MLSDTLRKTRILADKNYSFSDPVCLPSATKLRKFSERFYLQCNCEHTKSRLTKRSRLQMSSQGSSESCRLQCQRHKTTGYKKCRKLYTVRPGKKEAVQGNRKDLNFAAGSPRTRTQFSISTMWFHWNTLV